MNLYNRGDKMQICHTIKKTIFIIIIITLFIISPVYADDEVVENDQNETISIQEENPTKKTIIIMVAGISLVVFFCTAIFGEKEE